MHIIAKNKFYNERVEVVRALEQITINKAIEPDGISATLLKFLDLRKDMTAKL